MRTRAVCFLLMCGCLPLWVFGEDPLPPLRAETRSLPSGAKLITYFQRLPGQRELPLAAVLKDTLDDSDPGNDHLRQVWVFTYSRPSLWQHLAGSIPFLYRRAGLESEPRRRPPRALLDMAAPSRGKIAGMALARILGEALDSTGTAGRLTLLSYQNNMEEYRRAHVWEALDVISAAPAAGNGDLTANDRESLQGRLELSGHTLGAFVGNDYLQRAFEKYRAGRAETRGHNWELLRQRAEENGLYFEPLNLAGLPVSFALLWVAESDLALPQAKRFDPQFLNITSPFEDERLLRWTGYSQTWYRDQDGVRVSADTPGAIPARMIPLALYALDYPRVPFLLVDVRDTRAPQRREVAHKLVRDVTTGLLDVTGWSYVAAKTSWLFVRGRHGAATNRAARQRVLVQLRNALGADETLDPALRREIMARAERLALNPLEKTWEQEVRNAWGQYDALMSYADAPQRQTAASQVAVAGIQE